MRSVGGDTALLGLSAALALVGTVAGHGAVVRPAPRNAIDKDLAPVRAACVRAAACHYLSGHLPLTCCQCPLPANAAVEWSGAVHLGGQVPERRDGDRVVPCPGHGRKDLGAEWPVVLLVLEWVSSPPPQPPKPSTTSPLLHSHYSRPRRPTGQRPG